MSDKQKALAVLHIASQTCSAALKALRDPNTVAHALDADGDVSLDTRLNDYTSLLSLLYQDATKLAIALKPSSLTYPAVTSPAKELAVHADALASCAYSVTGVEYGCTLSREVRWSAEDVLSALEALIGVYTADAHHKRGEDEDGAGETYLIRTGVVHEAIDRARRISRSNREAVRKRWEGVLGGLADCETEVKEIVEDEEQGSDDEEGDGDVSDDLDNADGWGELNIGTSSKREIVEASKEELSHLKSAHSLFKFTHALLKRVDLVILGVSSSSSPLSTNSFDGLLANCEAILKGGDELVNALYIPQTRDTLSNKAKSFIAPIEDLRKTVSTYSPAVSIQRSRNDTDAIADLSKKAASIKLEALSDEDKKAARERKWFDTCFTQIFKSAEGLL